MKILNVCLTLFTVLLFISGCSTQTSKENNRVSNVSRHSVYNLDADSIKELDKGVLKGTPLKLDNDIKLSDIEKDWGKPTEHRDYEDIQTYIYLIKGQKFIVEEDEMKDIYMIQVDLDYSKKEILKLMGKPTEPGHIFIYEKDNCIVQFEKYDDKWRLILRR